MVEGYISELSEEVIKTAIEARNPTWDITKVVKIPNNPKLMKIICESPRVADEMVEKGMTIFSQRFMGRSLEKEVFINVTPCLRCYKYDHHIKQCTAPVTYKVCSECAETGHRYSECRSVQKKCLNCGQNHKTLAFKCPIRKDIVKKKLNERKGKTQRVPEPDLRKAIESQIREDLPDNYLTVIASAVTLADMREQECPGTFQYVMDEMYRANNLPKVKIPSTVITGYQHHRTQKRAREPSDMSQRGEDEGGLMLTTISRESIPSSLCLLGAPLERSSSSMSIRGAPTPAHTPTSTPRSTPAGTPAQSPGRTCKSDQGAVPKVKPSSGPASKKDRKEEDPGVVLFTFRDSKLPRHRVDHNTIVKHIKTSQILRYIYRNKGFKEGMVWSMIQKKQVNLTHCTIYDVDKEQYDRVRQGQYLDLKLEKLALAVRQNK